MTTNETITLYRPVGVAEAQLILEAELEAFPPRLAEQPIFYPVLNFKYAEQIARDWNTKGPESGFAGFVTRFKVDKDYVDQFEPQRVGSSVHMELWVLAEELDTFNQHIQGPIEFVAAYYGDGYRGIKHWHKDWYAVDMFWGLFMTRNPHDISGEVQLNRNAILLNFVYWATHDFGYEYFGSEIPQEEKTKFLQRVARLWRQKFPEITLPGAEEFI